MGRRTRQRHLSSVDGVAFRREQLEAVVAAIRNGELDEDLSLLYASVVERIETVQAVQTATALLAVEVGDRVALNQHVRPQYLRGATGTVASLVGDEVVVALDRPTGRFRSGQLRCSPLALEKPGPALLPSPSSDAWHPQQP